LDGGDRVGRGLADARHPQRGQDGSLVVLVEAAVDPSGLDVGEIATLAGL
jgi:hypothetical protein